MLIIVINNIVYTINYRKSKIICIGLKIIYQTIKNNYNNPKNQVNIVYHRNLT